MYGFMKGMSKRTMLGDDNVLEALNLEPIFMAGYVNSGFT